MTSPDGTDQPTPQTDQGQPKPIASRPPPKRRIPLRKALIGAAIGVLFLLGKHLFFDDNAPDFLGPKGPKYTSSGVSWRSFDPTWSTLLGEQALDMNLVALHKRG